MITVHLTATATTKNYSISTLSLIYFYSYYSCGNFRNAEYHCAGVIMLSVVVPNGVMISVIMLRVVVLAN